VTKRKRALRYKGDLSANFHPGQVIGQGTDGRYRRVTVVTYDRVRKVTLVEVELVEEIAPDGQRLRFYGDALDTGAVPEPSLGQADPIEPA
jgi:hypothetical protein